MVNSSIIPCLFLSLALDYSKNLIEAIEEQNIYKGNIIKICNNYNTSGSLNWYRYDL